ncbi:DUF599 family protein [Pseudosulfitobacter sp. SM2401]|uniref:DUF599 domain-containing protein n=1 Tax=Pseudosulfitobacter sp. SM2401 TaxID=3350098 RepID=UPI0036F2D612
MTWTDRIAFFAPLDFAAVTLLIAGWLLIGWWIDRPSQKNPSVSNLMASYRREWMEQMVTRDPRIFDAQILASLRQGTAFFASTSMIAIGGTLAMIGNGDKISGIANELILASDPAFVWEIKLILIALLLTNAFLKFVWSNRLFGYTAVLVASVPNDITDPRAVPRSHQAAAVSITAARGFNRGLRSVYFALTTAAWLAGPVPLLCATVFTLGVIYRREFASVSRRILMDTQA